jgi:hypothetical protein
LQHIARTLPAPMNEDACESLSECLEKSGRGALPVSNSQRSISIKLQPNQSVQIKFG